MSQRLLATVTGLAFLTLAACHSNHIEITVQNRTGSPIQLLEVDYPSASFGADALAPGATFHYRIQVQGSGPLALSYTAAGGKQTHITGPALSDRQQGSLDILLLPGSKADFHPHLTTGP